MESENGISRFGPLISSMGRSFTEVIEAGLEDGRALGAGRYHGLTYEELLATPEPVLRSLCSFLGEDFDPVLLQPTRIPRPDAQPVQWDDRFDRKLDASSVARWRREMPAADEIVFESVAGDLLRQLGYETDGVTRAIGRVERERWEWRDRAGLVHWRLTAWDRLPRARTSCLRTRSRVLKRLGRTAAP